ncbi:transglycosylase family protein [Mycobacterium asiaticum]|uniref:transglycosylase family protein n=1 Tax=Mycobacterium asiaticum TaxID=1790 RepID=UPI0009BD9D53|nr:M15 family metallopeptidase [Mycobacterium asiaticum]
MARRTVYGNNWSSNGWPMVDEGSCTWVTVPGTDVSLQIQNGQPLAILRAFAADFNAEVEPLRDADSACWTATNSVGDSNHLSGTAMDLNWNSHPFQIADAGFDAAKRAKVRELLNWYEGMVFWGNDWTNPKDAMHFQLASLANGGNINTYGNPAVDDFIKRKIRADGFSTRRGSAPAAPPTLTVPLVQNADGTWTSPSPAWAHLIMRESSGNPTIIQQIIDVNSGGNEAEGLFQITPKTWKANGGTEFAPSARFATPQQQAIVAARIFTRNPSGSDWGAGLPGREDPKQLAAGLAPTTTNNQQEGPLMALTDDEQQELLTKVRDIWDQLRGPGGEGWPQLGQNDQGQNLTPVDGLASVIEAVSVIAGGPITGFPLLDGITDSLMTAFGQVFGNLAELLDGSSSKPDETEKP